MKYGRLTLTGPRQGCRVECRCDCGAVKFVRLKQLQDGVVKSCGCLLKEKAAQRCIDRETTHGMSKVPEYNVWNAMRERCTNPKLRSFKDYGARGITVCERWSSFENFYADMGPRPVPGMSLERMNNDGNYEPGNVRWATATEQARNRRSSVLVTFNGRTATIAEWADRTGLSQLRISERLRAGWSPERALTEPKRRTTQTKPLNQPKEPTCSI